MAILKEPLPIGAIILWVGKAKDIPKGWAVCDGVKGTQDLRTQAGQWGITAFIVRVR